MQQAARSSRTRVEHTRPALRLVPANAGASRRVPLRSSGSLEARCRGVFTTVVALLIALTSLGLARVAVIARAAETTISADRLARQIKEQRIETDQLEIDRSSLSTPSRIGGIAVDTMRMGDPASVSYVEIPASGGAQSPAGAASEVPSVATAGMAGTEPSAAQRLGTMMATLADVSAGEAQSLLVGDLGLAGSR